MSVVATNRPALYSRSEKDYIDVFNALLKRWKTETFLYSSVTEITNHPAFIGIIELGDKVIPLIIGEIEKAPSLIMEALPILTGEDPISESDYGDIPAMAASWIEWYNSKR